MRKFIADPKKSPPDNFCPLTNPQPYQRERDKPRQGVVANILSRDLGERRLNAAKTMVKNTYTAVNTAIALASHLIHRGSVMRKA
jgi:hypothetical protein